MFFFGVVVDGCYDYFCFVCESFECEVGCADEVSCSLGCDCYSGFVCVWIVDDYGLSIFDGLNRSYGCA